MAVPREIREYNLDNVKGIRRVRRAACGNCVNKVKIASDDLPKRIFVPRLQVALEKVSCVIHAFVFGSINPMRHEIRQEIAVKIGLTEGSLEPIHICVFHRLCVILVLASFAACALEKPLKDTSRLELSISNSDVRWDGSYVGLLPQFSGAAKEILDNRAVDFKELVKALGDKRRFIAAHALLTMLTGHVIESPTGGGIDPVTGNILSGTEFGAKFNGLRVDLFADGRVVIPENQQAGLIKKWNESLRRRK